MTAGPKQILAVAVRSLIDATSSMMPGKAANLPKVGEPVSSENGLRLADIRKKRNIVIESGNEAEPPAQLSHYKDVPCRYSPDYRAAMSSQDSQAQRPRPPQPSPSLAQP